MKIFLDDVRDAPDESWIVVRSADECLKLLHDLGEAIETLSLDHDLGGVYDDDGFMEFPTGMFVASALEAWAATGRWDRVPPIILIHSANPVGRKNMQAAIDSIERMRNAARSN